MQPVGRCFVCDCKLDEKDKITFSRIDVAKTVSYLLGGEYVIVIDEEDRLCKVCNSLVSRVGRLEKMFAEANANLLTLLRAKHSACPQKPKRPRSKAVEREAECGTCFVCDSLLSQADIKTYVRSDVAQVIGNLLGGGYVILIGEQDYLCRVCLSLAQRIHRLNGELQPSKASLRTLLRVKYSISPAQSPPEEKKVKPSPKTAKAISVTDESGLQICELPNVGSAVELVGDVMNLPCQIQTVTSLNNYDSSWDQSENTTVTSDTEEITQISSCESSFFASLADNDQSGNISLPCESFMTLNGEPQLVDVTLSSTQSVQTFTTLTSCESNFVLPSSRDDQIYEQCVEIPYTDNISTQTINAIPTNESSGGETVINTARNIGKKRHSNKISHLGFDIEAQTKTFCDKSVSTDDLPGSLYFKGGKINLINKCCQVSDSDFKELNSKKFSSEEYEVGVGPKPDVHKQKTPEKTSTQVSININIGTEKAVDIDYIVKNSNENVPLQKNIAVNQRIGSNCVSEKDNMRMRDDSELIDLKYYCADCEFESSTYDELKMHIRNPGNGNFCNICEVGFHRKSNLKIHLKYHPHTSELRKCLYCRASLRDRTHYHSHFRWTHKALDKQLPFCTDCKIGFTYRRSLRRHLIKKHGRPIRYPCLQCDQVFPVPEKLNKHVSCYHRESPNCKYCGKQEEDIQKLFLHEKNHQQDIAVNAGLKKNRVCHWRLKCCFCRKKFNTKLEVVAHSAKCRLRFRFTCEECGKPFTNNYSLQQHRGRNCDTCSQYQCEQCGKLFKMLAHLRYHITKKHPGPLPHSCLTCHKRFATHRCLKRHQRQYHSASYYIFSCQTCKKSFTKAYVYIAHAIRVHQDYSVLEELGASGKNALEVPSV